MPQAEPNSVTERAQRARPAKTLMATLWRPAHLSQRVTTTASYIYTDTFSILDGTKINSHIS